MEAEIDSVLDILIVQKSLSDMVQKSKKMSVFISDLYLDYKLYLRCCCSTLET